MRFYLLAGILFLLAAFAVAAAWQTHVADMWALGVIMVPVTVGIVSVALMGRADRREKRRRDEELRALREPRGRD